MKLRTAIRDSVHARLLKSWLILGASAIGASVLVLLLLIVVERRNHRLRVADDLRSKAGVVARRLSSELLVGERGDINPVVSGLRQELGLDLISLLPEGVDCASQPKAGPCIDLTRSTYVWKTERLPHLPKAQYVLVGQGNALLSTAFPWSTLAVAALSLIGTLLSGIVLQWTTIRRHILRPISALLDSGGRAETSERWPSEIRNMSDKLRTLLDERDKATSEAHRLKTETLVHDLSQRILHDLKSPLATLGMMVETDLQDVPVETKDSIRKVLSRIRGIVDTNLKEYSADALAQAPLPGLLPAVTDSPASIVGGAVRTIVEEESAKAYQRGVEITADLPRAAYHTFAPVSFSELCRVFSNLIVNAAEAAEQGRKKVYVAAHVSDTHCEISIRDFGHGFDPAALRRLREGKRGSTKPNGAGLGLLTAKALIEQAGGELIVSGFGDGTNVRVRLPVIDAPAWFHDITRTSANSILALDDDATMGRQLSALFPKKRVSVFQDEQEFISATVRDENALPLVDYHFGGDRTGLDLIIGQGLTRRAVLLSGRIAFDPKIRIAAQANGVRMFPKECLG